MEALFCFEGDCVLYIRGSRPRFDVFCKSQTHGACYGELSNKPKHAKKCQHRNDATLSPDAAGYGVTAHGSCQTPECYLVLMERQA